jgi:flavin reductase (DIM6/NTAB) family NADH-FMN oxidoreductase RutF
MERAERRAALRLISNGLFVLTARDGGDIGAATVSWVTQCSFEPPLVLVAVRRGSNVHRCLREGGPAALHVIGRGQESVARAFFTATRVEDGQLNGEPVRAGAEGAPLLEALPDRLEARVHARHETGGDHDLVVLEVLEAHRGSDRVPLTVADSPWEYGG